MNSFQRVMNRLQGKPVDRIPNLSIVMMFAAKELGVPYSDCCRDHRLLADAAFLCHARYGIDMVKSEVRRCKTLGKRNNNFIAPGCEVPKDTPPENMLALLAALEEDADEN